MHTAEYKYQVGQIVYQVDYDHKEIRTVRIQQVSIDVYSNSRGIPEQDTLYTVHLITGMACAENVDVDEVHLFETAADAAASLLQVLN